MRHEKPNHKRTMKQDMFILMLKKILIGSLVILFTGVCSFFLLFISICLI